MINTGSFEGEKMLTVSGEHQHIKYHNNVIRSHYWALKRMFSPILGLKRPESPFKRIKGLKVKQALRKGQAKCRLSSVLATAPLIFRVDTLNIRT